MSYGQEQIGTNLDVDSWLASSGYPGLQDVQCECDDGLVVLTGAVPSYYLKQVAQTLVGNLVGLTHIENRLEVQPQRMDRHPR